MKARISIVKEYLAFIRKGRILLLMSCIYLLPVSIWAQGLTLTGSVTDSSGEPIVGASVVLKGSSTRTVTDLYGKFILNDVPKDAVLDISYLGFMSEEVAIDGRTSIAVILNENPELLDEIVVVGYGSVKKSDITGSLSSVSRKEIDKQPVLNVATAIQGKVPGVVIANVDGNPGSGLKFRIRGANSINGSNEPLYVIDGVVGNINSINVNDVASIEILKDASATAIYGSRGANGVVLISTKRGTSGKTKVQFNANFGVANLAKKYDVMDAVSYAELSNKIFKTELFTNEQINNYKQNGATDWQDQLFQTGTTQDYQISLSGGNETTSFYLSGNYTDQTGVVVNTNAEKYNLRSNISTQFLDKFRLDLDLTASKLEKLNTADNGSKGSPLWLASIMSPTYSPYNEDGSWNRTRDNIAGPGSGYTNPLMILKERHTDYLSTGWGLNTKLNYQIIDGLTLDLIYSTGYSTDKKGVISNQYVIGENDRTSASQTVTQYYGWQNSNILTYNKKFAKIHELTFTAVNEQSSSTEAQVYAGAVGIDPISLGYDALGSVSGEDQSASSYRKEYTLQSYLGRVFYSLMDRYLLTMSFRADGSSKFAQNNKWGYFPSAALAWRVSEEDFISSFENLSNLKLRASWGLTGSQGFDVYSNMSTYSGLSHSFGQQSSFAGSYLTGSYNPDLKWETTEQFNLGFDLGLFSGRFNFTADYYVKNTRDLLLNVSIPDYNGGGSVLKNIGSVSNKGLEFNVFAIPVLTKDFNWEVNFNVSTYKNRVVDLGGEEFIMGTNPNNGMITTSPFIIKVGESLGSYYGYTWDGIWQSSEAAEAAKYGLKPGDNKYHDWNSDYVIDSSDQSVIGNSNPKFTWGLDNTFSYKNFSLNVMLQAAHGREMLNVSYAAAATIISDAPAISLVDGADYWTADNESAKFANPFSDNYKNHLISTQFLQDGSYVKFKNVALSYFIDKRKTKLADMKLTLSAQNLLTLTKYKGYDPEATTYWSDTEGALDMGAYPSSRSFTLGVQVNF